MMSQKARTVSEVEQDLSAGLKRPVTLAGLADKWSEFCTTVGAGYQLTIHDYVHDVSRRDTLQDAIDVLGNDQSAWLTDLVSPADHAYQDATRDDPEDLLGRWIRHGDGWWWHRVPRKLGSLAGLYGIYPKGDPRQIW